MANLGDKTVELLRADSGFFDEKILLTLEEKRIACIIAARLILPLQRKIYRTTGWWALAPGLELTEITYQAQSWQQSRRVVVVRQSVNPAILEPHHGQHTFPENEINNFNYKHAIDNDEEFLFPKTF
ncbi:MAG: hypothetical protein HQL86_02905 [Magnetococcales bacterium]|nr:hypothetical protein [Magnetococcales bacterium]